MLNCLSAQVSINNKKVDLSYSFTESRAIRTCVDSSPCDRRPCLNGGHCLSSAEYEYQCLCQDGFEGAFKVPKWSRPRPTSPFCLLEQLFYDL